jgi:hypothetical protein
LCSQLFNLLLILFERLSLLKACFVLGSVLPARQLKRFATAFRKRFSNKKWELWDERRAV